MSDINPHGGDLDDSPLSAWKRVIGWGVTLALLALVAWGIFG